jgi:FkbM family methyltransferase
MSFIMQAKLLVFVAAGTLHVCNALKSAEQASQLSHRSKIMRGEIQERILEWPRWGKYFSNLHGLTFVQIGANNGVSKGSVQGDPIWEYATKHRWKGIAIEPNPSSFAELTANYAPYPSVKPLQVAISDKDGLVDLHMGDGPANSNEADTIMPGSSFTKAVKVKSLTLASLWKQEVTSNLPKVDIMAIDVEGAEPKLLRGLVPSPKPRFILFEYYHLKSSDLSAIRENLERQGYKYADRDSGDELHELKQA